MRSVVLNLQSIGRFYAAKQLVSTTSRRRHCFSLLSILVTSALAFSATFSFHASRALTQTRSQQEREILRVESWFTGKSLAQIKSDLAKLRPEAVSPSDKAYLMKDLPLVNTDNRIHDNRQLDQLHARLERILMFFERKGVVELILFHHHEPIVISKPGVVVIISTEVLKIVDDDDAALNGVIAHELAHEFVAMERYQATQSGNLGRMRQLELFCDAVAVVVLLDLKLDSGAYARALRRIANHSNESAKLNNGENSHPALDARLRVISFISALCGNGSAIVVPSQ